MELPFALVVITEMLDTWSKLSSKYESVSGNGLSLDGLYLDGSKNAYPLPAYGMKPDVLEMPPKTLAESPYAANDGFAAVNAAAPCVQKGGFREIHLVRFLPAKMIHQRGNWWIREIKSRFLSQKLSKQKKNKFESKNFDQLLLLRFSTPSFLKIDVYCFEDFIVARECALVGSIERSHRGRVCALSKRKRSITIAFRRREEREFCNRIADKKTKKNISRRTANKDIACLRSTVSSLDAKVTFEVRETDFTERCRFKLSVLATDAFALMWMDWTIEAIIIIYLRAVMRMMMLCVQLQKIFLEL